MSKLQKLISRLLRNTASIIGWYVLPFGYLPINRNKIVVSSYYSRGYSDNPKSIIDALLARNVTMSENIVCITDDSSVLPRGIKSVKPRSLLAAYHMRTAKVWIDNSRKSSYIRKRSGQRYMQTWHGCPFKRIEADVKDKLEKSYVKSAINDSSMCDLMLSDSAYTTSIYSESFWYTGEILTCGLPRDDILIKSNVDDLSRLRKQLGIPEHKKTIVYAPTFRRDLSLNAYDLDYATLINSLENRFGGEWVVLIRLHPIVAETFKTLISSKSVIDVSNHHDTQEVLLVADALVTDYSSIMFDFMLTGRPGFLYANDIEDYAMDRAFYFDITKLPYSLATNNRELTQNIETLNVEKQAKNVKRFLADMGSVADGDASLTAAIKIEQWLDEGM